MLAEITGRYVLYEATQFFVLYIFESKTVSCKHFDYLQFMLLSLLPYLSSCHGSLVPSALEINFINRH